MFTLTVGLVLLLVSVGRGENCDWHSVTSCPNQDQDLLKNEMVLINTDSFIVVCRQYAELFSCVEKHVGNCSIKDQMRWRPLQYLTEFTCNGGQKDYLKNAKCWQKDEVITELNNCNEDMRDNTDGVENPDEFCGFLDEFVKCTKTETANACNKEAGEVMEMLASRYTVMMKLSLKCIPKDPFLTTTTNLPKNADADPPKAAVTNSSLYANMTTGVTMVTNTSTSKYTTADQSTGRRSTTIPTGEGTASDVTSGNVITLLMVSFSFMISF